MDVQRTLAIIETWNTEPHTMTSVNKDAFFTVAKRDMVRIGAVIIFVCFVSADDV